MSWERLSVAAPALGVDRESRVIRGFVVAQAGAFRTPGRGEFDAPALSRVVELNNAARQGIKSRFSHPMPMGRDGIGSFLGRVTNARLDGDKVRADLHLAKSASKTPQGDLADYVMTLVEEDAAALGSSLVLTADKVRRLDQAGRPMLSADGHELAPLWRPTAVYAADLVDEGEAVRDGLLSVAAATAPDRGVYLRLRLAEVLYSPSQPRDKDGKWTDGPRDDQGGKGFGSAASPKAQAKRAREDEKARERRLVEDAERAKRREAEDARIAKGRSEDDAYRAYNRRQADAKPRLIGDFDPFRPLRENRRARQDAELEVRRRLEDERRAARRAEEDEKIRIKREAKDAKAAERRAAEDRGEGKRFIFFRADAAGRESLAHWENQPRDDRGQWAESGSPEGTARRYAEGEQVNARQGAEWDEVNARHEREEQSLADEVEQEAERREREDADVADREQAEDEETQARRDAALNGTLDRFERGEITDAEKRRLLDEQDDREAEEDRMRDAVRKAADQARAARRAREDAEFERRHREMAQRQDRETEEIERRQEREYAEVEERHRREIRQERGGEA